ncbi:hypothetical protein GOP47_0000579 [Adiantum capillus-veneris]|uniref:Uncharacterized protein n=1 Tax=Adiantum capillus-veneris TaxID=13818 RepID=A0A9D4VE78_ADICA|nr:hypothetical protein GOP47_0000579 [Adiantum capillus-veneris]
MAANGLKADKFPFPRRTSNFTPTTKGINFSSDVQSDIILSVDGVTFSLHKFPLMTRSGRIRRLVGEELKEGDQLVSSPPMIEFSNFPGGPDIFELAAKFCYGINFEITTSKVACLRCAAEFLEMTDDYGEDNLITRSEAFLTEVVFKSLDKCVEVLHSCESILPLAEEVKLVNRCIDIVASKVCSEQQQKLSSLLQMEGTTLGQWHSNGELSNEQHIAVPPTSNWTQNGDSTPPVPPPIITRAKVEWWAEYFSPLRVDLYQRLFAAMKANGVRIESLAGSIMHYAQTSLKTLGGRSNGPSTIQASSTTAIRLKSKPYHLDINFGHNQKLMQQHEQRAVLETMVSLLPTERNLFPTNFLLSLLRNAIALDTTVACRLDLERRIGVQFEQVTVDELLIPTLSPHAGDAMFDVDVVQRVLVNYLQQQEEKVKHEQNFSLNMTSDFDDTLSSPASQKGIAKVAKVMDMYLAEIGADPNLKASKFSALAEQLPSYVRALDDGLYRAIDIFLKAHPTLSDIDRRKICKVLDCQKLSKEACIHAAQNERLPVQMVVQVLYFEQIRMRSAMGGGDDCQHPDFYQQENGPGNTYINRNLYRASGVASPRLDTYSSLRRENRELKQEVANLKLRVAELQKENTILKQEAEKLPVTNGSSGRFFSSVSRRLGKMNPFTSKVKETMKPSETRPTQRQRRHSVS